MNNEFKKITNGTETRYILESATAGATSSSSVPTRDSSLGKVQRRNPDNILAQEGDKDKVPANKPRNFVAKNAKMGGAGAHKDKKKAQKQGQEKHKKPYAENIDELKDRLETLKENLADQLAAFAKKHGGTVRTGPQPRKPDTPKSNVKPEPRPAPKYRDPNIDYSDDYSTWAAGRRDTLEQDAAEGLGKSIKRGMAGWGAFDKDKPADVVKRVKGQDTDTLKGLSRTGPTGRGSPAELQQKAISRELKKRGEQGVAEQYDRSVDIGQQMANDGITYSPERENEIIGKMAEYMKRSGFSSKQIRYLMNYDEDYIADQLGYLPREQGVAEAGNKPVEKYRLGMGDNRTARELKTQMQGASDEFVNWAAKDVGPFHSRVAKMQGKLAKSELRRRAADHDRLATGTNEGVAEGAEGYHELRDKVEQIIDNVYSKYRKRDSLFDVAKPMAMKVAQQMGLEKYFDEIWSNARGRHDIDTNFGRDEDDFDYTDYTMRKGERGVAEGFRLIGTKDAGNRTVKFFRDTEWNEYVVRFYTDGEYREEEDYHTDDKQDAMDTAKSWLKGFPKIDNLESVTEGDDDNFTIDDIKRLEKVGDLSTMKELAKELIKGKPVRRMKPEKIRYFYDKVDSLNSPLKVIKLMYDLLLAGEGHRVLGSRNSMNPNSYRQKFGEASSGTLKVAKDDEQQTVLQNPTTGVQTQINKKNPNAPRLTQDEQGKLKLSMPQGAQTGGLGPKKQEPLVGKDVQVDQMPETLDIKRLAGLK